MKVIYTALFGDYEELKEPTVITPGWKYVCFSDQPLKSDIWQIINTDVIDTPRRTARWYKIMGWIDWEESIWIDCSFQINVDLNEWWERYAKKDFNAAKHPLRTCVYREAEACIVGKRGEEELIKSQIDHYKRIGVKDYQDRVITSGMMLRRNTPETIKLCELWWAEVAKWSTRDQIAFYRISEGFDIHTFRWDYSQSKELKYHKHYAQRH